MYLQCYYSYHFTPLNGILRGNISKNRKHYLLKLKCLLLQIEVCYGPCTGKPAPGHHDGKRRHACRRGHCGYDTDCHDIHRPEVVRLPFHSAPASLSGRMAQRGQPGASGSISSGLENLNWVTLNAWTESLTAQSSDRPVADCSIRYQPVCNNGGRETLGDAV